MSFISSALHSSLNFFFYYFFSFNSPPSPQLLGLICMAERKGCRQCEGPPMSVSIQAAAGLRFVMLDNTLLRRDKTSATAHKKSLVFFSSSSSSTCSCPLLLSACVALFAGMCGIPSAICFSEEWRLQREKKYILGRQSLMDGGLVEDCCFLSASAAGFLRPTAEKSYRK